MLLGKLIFNAYTIIATYYIAQGFCDCYFRLSFVGRDSRKFRLQLGFILLFQQQQLAS